MRIALMLRGHARTWRWTIPTMIQRLTDCTPQIDAYVCLWKSQSFGQRELRELSAMLPTVHAELTNLDQWDIGESCDSYTAPSWQGARLAAARRKRESLGTVYDMIIDTRTDIYIETCPAWFTQPSYGQLLSTMVSDPWLGSNLPGMEDHLLIMDHATHDTWCRRHERRYDLTYNHCILHRYCLDLGLQIRTIPWMRTSIVRPNWHAYAHLGMDCQILHTAQIQWSDMDPSDRVQWCRNVDLDPEEYSAPFHVGNLAFTWM